MREDTETLLSQKLIARVEVVAQTVIPSVYHLLDNNTSIIEPIEGLPIYLGYQCEACEKFFLSQSTFRRNHKCSKVG